MRLATHRPTTTRLAHRKILDLRNRTGDRVECLDGSVWITQDGDPRDVILGAGESFTLDRPGTALVYALEDARVDVQQPKVPAMPVAPAGLGRLRALGLAPRSAT